MFSIAVVFILTFSVTKLLIPQVSRIVFEAGFVKPNYLGEKIPLSLGIIFPIVFIPSALIILSTPWVSPQRVLGLAFALLALSLLGLIDDFFGDRSASGLAGHFKLLFKKGILTTGALKALTGGFVALVVTLAEMGSFFRWTSQLEWLVVFGINSLIVALSINAINLLDLRPGRAGKGFLFFTLLLVPFIRSLEQLMLLSIFWGLLLAYMPIDLKAKAMMGDAGSNTLGVALGVLAVYVLPWWGKSIYLAFLVGFHILTEKVSLTKLIEENQFLKYIDMLGRRG